MLVVTSFATVGFAAGNGTMKANDKEAYIGETVEVKVTVKSEDGFANFEMFVNVASPLSITDISGDGVVANMKTGKVAWASAKDVTSKSFTVTIKVGEDAQVGKSYPVSLTNLFVSDENLEDLSISVDNGSVTIKCKHKWELVERVNPTCGKDGYEKSKCSVCGETKTDVLPATGAHTYGDWTVVEAATCDKDGRQERTCSVCGKVDSAVIPATGHQFVCDETSWKADAEFHWHECSVCGMRCADHYAAHVPSEYWVISENDSSKEELLCEICGHVLDTRAVEGPVDPDVPGTGDPTAKLMLVGGFSLMLLVMLAVALYMIKRKASAK